MQSPVRLGLRIAPVECVEEPEVAQQHPGQLLSSDRGLAAEQHVRRKHRIHDVSHQTDALDSFCADTMPPSSGLREVRQDGIQPQANAVSAGVILHPVAAACNRVSAEPGSDSTWCRILLVSCWHLPRRSFQISLEARPVQASVGLDYMLPALPLSSQKKQTTRARELYFMLCCAVPPLQK